MSLEPSDFHEFDVSEYTSRYRRARELMAQSNIDALLVTDQRNYRYFTGHSPRSLNRIALFVLPIDDDPVILCAQELGVHDAIQMSHVQDIRGFSLPFRAEALQQLLKEKKLSGKRIGLELEDTFFCGLRTQLQPGHIATIEQSMGAAFIDASTLLWHLRMIKSQAGVTCIRRACEITSTAYQQTYQRISEGMTERRVAEILVCAMLEAGADCPALGKQGPSGPIIIDASRPAHEPHVPCDAPLHKGDLVHLDTGAIYNGYYADFTRSAVVGSPSNEQRTAYAEMVESVDNAIRSLSPGSRLGDIPVHWHSVGLDFVEAPFGGILSKGIHGDIVAQPGMVLAIENMKSAADGTTFHFEENVLITEKGIEVLSLADKELSVIT